MVSSSYLSSVPHSLRTHSLTDPWARAGRAPHLFSQLNSLSHSVTHSHSEEARSPSRMPTHNHATSPGCQNPAAPIREMTSDKCTKLQTTLYRRAGHPLPGVKEPENRGPSRRPCPPPSRQSAYPPPAQSTKLKGGRRRFNRFGRCVVCNNPCILQLRIGTCVVEPDRTEPNLTGFRLPCRLSVSPAGEHLVKLSLKVSHTPKHT